MNENFKRADFWALPIFIFIGLVSFFRILSFDFTDVDALSLIQTGRFTNAKDIWNIITHELMLGRMPNATYYRPLLSFLYGLQGMLFGLKPWPYHLVDILLHCLNATLVFGVCRLLLPTKNPALAYTAGIFFLWHPLQVENVAAIARQGDLWVTTTILGALCFTLKYLNKKRRCYFWISVLLVFLAPFIKEPGIVAGPVMILAFLLFTRDFSKTIRHGLVYFIAAVLFLILRTWVLRGVGGYVSAPDRATGFMHALSWIKADVLGHGFGLLLAGFSSAFLQKIYLTIRHPSWVWGLFWVSTLGLGSLYIFSRRKEPVALLCVGFIFLQFVMMYASFFLFRYLYLTLAPVAWLAVWELYYAGLKFRADRKIFAGALALLILAPALWAGPLVHFAPYEKWRESADISRHYLENLKQAIEDHPQAEHIFLLSIPYKKYNRPTTDYFWEIPMTQILLEHAVQDFVTMAFAQRKIRILGVSYLHIWEAADRIQHTAHWTSPTSLKLEVSPEAEMIDYPWVKIPGRVSGSDLFAITRKSKTPGNVIEIDFTAQAMALENPLFLLPNPRKGMTVLAPPGQPQGETKTP